MAFKEYFVTFGRNHGHNPDGYFVIEAPDEEIARRKAHELFGEKFSTMRPVETMQKSYFPDGEIGRITAHE